MTTPKRKLQTPGAQPAIDETPIGANESNPHGEDISNEISTEPESIQIDESTEAQSTPESIQVDDARLDLILENQKRIESKLDQLLKAGGIEAKKKTRWIQGEHGLEQKEI